MTEENKTCAYFDWTATTKPTAGVIGAVNRVMSEEWGNPSSVHRAGNRAARLLASARESVMCGMGFGRAPKGKLIFTSGGTEADALALLGSAYAKKKRGRLLITEGEHAAVEKCAARLEEDGFEVLRVPTRGGELDLDFIREHADGVVTASLMLVNNETGALYDVAAAAKIIRAKSPDAFIHTDAVQGFMKVRFTPERLGVNAVSVSAHKIGALKGTGALYVDEKTVKEKRIVPIIPGGGQEDAYRSGTENVPGICAFGEAVRENLADYAERTAAVASLRAEFLAAIEGSVLRPNIPTHFIDNIVSVTVPGVKSETVLNFASENGYYISAGSACSSHGKKTSGALAGFGLDPADADSTVRVSLSHLNTPDEVKGLADVLVRASRELAKK